MDNYHFLWSEYQVGLNERYRHCSHSSLALPGSRLSKYRFSICVVRGRKFIGIRITLQHNRPSRVL